MNICTPYAFGKTVAADFDVTEQKMRNALQQEGFGILSVIDVAAKFKEKLGKDFRRYLILGACNPELAFEAFGQELNIGTLLPCNVVIYAADDSSTAVVIMDPEAALSLIGNPQVAGLAKKVREKLARALTQV